MKTVKSNNRISIQKTWYRTHIKISIKIAPMWRTVSVNNIIIYKKASNWQQSDQINENNGNKDRRKLLLQQQNAIGCIIKSCQHETIQYILCKEIKWLLLLCISHLEFERKFQNQFYSIVNYYAVYWYSPSHWRLEYIWLNFNLRAISWLFGGGYFVFVLHRTVFKIGKPIKMTWE